MKLGIMQPYLFPYIGYYQLIAAVDKFVVYDDVNFIKQGWINRNRILLNEKELLFTVPLKNASSFSRIKDTALGPTYFPWKEKFLKTLVQAYKKAPQFDNGYQLVCDVLNADCDSIAQLARQSIFRTCSYLGIDTEFVESSVKYQNDHLVSQGRVIDICKQEKAATYINAIGGSELYSKASFSENGISLSFIKSQLKPYQQLGSAFIPGLSVIDVLMNLDKDEVAELLNAYQFT